MRVLKFLLFLIIVTIVGVFAAHNSQLAVINFYPFGYEISFAVFLLVIGSVLIGAILAGLVCGGKIIHWKRMAKQKQKELIKLEKQLAENSTERQTKLGYDRQS